MKMECPNCGMMLDEFIDGKPECGNCGYKQ